MHPSLRNGKALTKLGLFARVERSVRQAIQAALLLRNQTAVLVGIVEASRLQGVSLATIFP